MRVYRSFLVTNRQLYIYIYIYSESVSPSLKPKKILIRKKKKGKREEGLKPAGLILLTLSLPLAFMDQAKKNHSLDALLSDICIATSAAPTYLPAHYFETKDEQTGEVREFNLIDGGVAANNPVCVKFT